MVRRGIFQDQFEADMGNVLAASLKPNDKPIRTASFNAQQTLIIDAADASEPKKSVATATSGQSGRKRPRRHGALGHAVIDVLITVFAMVAAFLVVNFLIVPNWGSIASWFGHLFGS